MKAQITSANSAVDYLLKGVDMGGKVHKTKKVEETESREINEYLNKLQELVPYTPKNKKLSKLEVISCVIDYIQDLRETLGLPPSPSQNDSDPLDNHFSWCLMDSADLDLTEDASPVLTSSPVLVQNQTRQPLSAIPNPGSEKDANQNYTSSVKTSTCINSTSSASTTNSN